MEERILEAAREILDARTQAELKEAMVAMVAVLRYFGVQESDERIL